MPAYKYTLKDGKTIKWYANFYYTDWTGQKKHVCKRGFKTQREAKEYERSFMDQRTKTCDILFSSLVENYLEDLSHRLKPTTMRTKRSAIENRILPYFANIKVCDIDTIKVRKWQNELLTHRDENENPYSNTYLRELQNQLSAIFNYAVSHYNLPANPCRTAGTIGKARSDEMNIWTQEQYESFSKLVENPAVKLALDILFYTGIRSGELLALTPSDIHSDRRISINKNYARLNGEDLLLTPKTPKSKRSIAIPDFLYDDIQKHILMLREIEPNDRIFNFTRQTLEYMLKKRAKEIGLPQIRVHDLRHSHASMLIELGFTPLEIADRLGHESVKTTLDTYSHLYPDKDQQLADRLNQFRRTE